LQTLSYNCIKASTGFLWSWFNLHGMSKRLRFLLVLAVLPILLLSQTKVTFVIESLPTTTPEEDTLYICGTFNNWEVHDLRYMLHKQLDGKYSIAMLLDSSIEYKFSRGSWLKVETNEKNEHMPNREYHPADGAFVQVKIRNWQDLGGIKRFQYLVFFLFATAFYGLAVLFIAFRIKKRNRPKLIAFLALCVAIVILLFGGAVYNQVNLIWRSYLTMLAHTLLFVWGPILYLSLKTLRHQKLPVIRIIHYLPLLAILLLIILRFTVLLNNSFLTREINPYLTWGNSIELWLGIIIVIVYHGLVLRHLQFKSISGVPKIEPEQKLVNTTYIISLLAVIVLIANYLLLLAQINIGGLANFEFVLIVLSFTILAEFYYLWNYPEILKDRGSVYALENAEGLKQRLLEVMNTQKPFKNPELNIAELSEMIESKPHILSRLLNESFHKNFRDFINEYRVNEFIELANSDHFKNFTFLALAYEVGFNSKSTFNLAFKKVTKSSPREYFK
jgi:AraC-like DNA-binding protein